MCKLSAEAGYEVLHTAGATTRINTQQFPEILVHKLVVCVQSLVMIHMCLHAYILLTLCVHSLHND